MENDRLRSAMHSNGLTGDALAKEIGIDPKTVQRWISKGRVPHRGSAIKAAQALSVPVEWLWPSLGAQKGASGNSSEVVAFYPHRSETPKQLWLDLLMSATSQIDLVAFASLFLPEENPEAIAILKDKAQSGVQVRIALGDPDSAEVELRGREEQLYEAIPARVRMAIAYYRPLTDVPEVSFHLHRTTLYNSIFRYDDEMLVNQHIFGTYGYLAPILHLRKLDGADLFNTYAKSFERIWEQSYPLATGPRTHEGGPLADLTP